MEEVKTEIFFCRPGGHLSSIAIWYIDSRLSEGGKSIGFFLEHVRKTYGSGGGIDGEGGEADGKERAEHLQKVYASLASKGVPNVDRLKKAKILHSKYGTFVDLEPVGISEGPKSLLDVRNAVVCVLEALEVFSISFYFIN